MIRVKQHKILKKIMKGEKFSYTKGRSQGILFTAQKDRFIIHPFIQQIFIEHFP